MGEVKVYTVTGRIRKPNLQTSFRKEIRALKPEDALEEVYKILGSKHKIKRFQIRVDGIEEAEASEAAQVLEEEDEDE